MRTFELASGESVFIDDADYAWAVQYKWHALRYKHLIYASRSITVCGHGNNRKRKTLLLHRELFGSPEGIEIDHRDGNGLNSTRHNLRIATRLQNARNQRKSRGISRFKGVTFNRSLTKWQAQLCCRLNGKLHNHYLGVFTDEISAAKAYNKAAQKAHQDFANLNCV